MRYLWSRLMILLLAVQSAGFIVYYNFGPRGLIALDFLQKTKQQLEGDIQRIKLENSGLVEQIENWKTDLFMQEKFARQNLSMQKEGEIIYFKGKKHV